MIANFQGRQRETAKTSAERSREFRKRNPTYHAEWKRRERAAIRAAVLARQAAATASERPVLMLPAPQPPAFDLLEQLAALRARQAELEWMLVNAAT